MSPLVRLGIQWVAQEALEQKVTDVLGRGHYERRGEALRGYRNGYRAATMDTAEGRIPLAVLQVREMAGPYHSKLVAFPRGSTDVLERLAVEMSTRGLPVRDVEAVFGEVAGEALLSRTAVSELTDAVVGVPGVRRVRSVGPRRGECALGRDVRLAAPASGLPGRHSGGLGDPG